MISRPRVLVLTSSLLTDRMLLWSDFLPELAASADVEVWCNSLSAGASPVWESAPAVVQQFPEVRPFRERFNLLRRIDEAAWDARLKPFSRLSMRRHRRNDLRPRARCMRLLGHLVARLGQEQTYEARLERVLLSQVRSEEAARRLEERHFDLVFSMSPFWFHEPPVVMEAKRKEIPVVALIPSWDNVSTKGRLVFSYDGYLVWSRAARDELHHFYPKSRDVPVEAVGVPQYDAFARTEFLEDRRPFLTRHGLDPDRAVVLYAIGSPNFLSGEVFGAVRLAEDLAAGRLGGAQMLVRPHPVHDKGRIHELFAKFAPRVVVQSPGSGGDTPAERSQDEQQVRDWINTFRHADVVVNLASTVCLDAAFFDRPIVNLNYDPQPGGSDGALIREINGAWPHLAPLRDSGAVWNVDDHDQLLRAVERYLAEPKLHSENRRSLLEIVCERTDGRNGVRMAIAIRELLVRLVGG